MEPPGLDPPRELTPDVVRIAISGKEEPGLEDRLVGHLGKEIFEPHAGILPEMANCCNE
jgi:hypothetical protein